MRKAAPAESGVFADPGMIVGRPDLADLYLLLSAATHVGAGAVALTLGLIPLFTLKGGAARRTWGRATAFTGLFRRKLGRTGLSR